jgi:hypothetical protein
MAETLEEIMLLQDILGIELPDSYKKYLGQTAFSQSRPDAFIIPGLPVSLEITSTWGATEYLRSSRPALDQSYITIWIDSSEEFCFALQVKDQTAAPVVHIDLTSEKPPEKIFDTLDQYLQGIRGKYDEILEKYNSQFDYGSRWFHQGLARLNHHMENPAFSYDHKTGGQIPRSHMWRPYRFCVQDVILGITVIRHDQRHNRLETDVFLTAEIPEYKSDSGCRALALILLSDAYQSGGSMEIRFTHNVEGGRVPAELCEMASEIGVELAHRDQGGITPKEAKTLYMALSDFDEEVRERILKLDEEGRLSAASVCYALHHGVWMAMEIDMIVKSSLFPDTILTGGFPAEACHLFQHDLFIARNAMMSGYLDRQLRRREHLPSATAEGDKIFELEDDERDVKCAFVAEHGVLKFANKEEMPMPVPWLDRASSAMEIPSGNALWVFAKARDNEDLLGNFGTDIDEAIEFKKNVYGDNGRVCILVTSDFKRLQLDDLKNRAEENGIGIIVCPEFANILDRQVINRFESLKVMRK